MTLATWLALSAAVLTSAAQTFPATNTPRATRTNGAATQTPPAADTATATAAEPSTPTPDDAGVLTPTLVPTNTPSATFTPTPSPSPTITPTFTPSQTPTFTATFTPSRTPEPTLVIMGTYITPIYTPVTAIPPAMPTPVPSGDDVVTVLLLGSDTTLSEIASRTDVIIAVAINRTRGTVSMIHFPRDLFVYVPNYTMSKINTVFQYGNQTYGPGEGAKLLKETIMYNFGIDINFYARVDFNEFQEIIGQLGGLDITVDCAVQGNRLLSPELDKEDPANYEVYTLNIGAHKLDPYMALWYVRARGSSSDIDRGRRQMEVLRAIWRQARAAGLVAQATVLWPQVQNIVETDMSLADVIGLAPLALSIDPANVQRIAVRQKEHFEEWYTADTGSFVWLPVREGWQTAVQNFALPPAQNRLGGESPTIEVGASAALAGYDLTAADRLSWEGFTVTLLANGSVANHDDIVVYDYTGGAKPSSLETLRKALRIGPNNIVNQPDPNATVDFRVEMGRSYGSSCMYSLPLTDQVEPTATETPAQ